MDKRTTAILIVAATLLGAAAAPSTAPSTKPAASQPASQPATAAAGRTAKDGIYTAEQLERGKKAYFASCARCHGDTLLGNDDALPLVGDEFLDKWKGKSVGKLVEYTRLEMPSDSPGKLSRKDCTDIVIYLLNQNGYPAGKAELKPELDELNGILLQEKK